MTRAEAIDEAVRRATVFWADCHGLSAVALAAKVFQDSNNYAFVAHEWPVYFHTVRREFAKLTGAENA